ncbi:MAG: efflux RND transporter periplasmic adaptor subunit [Ketobacter sp.]|nr:efflux RND transporter periplasmic adaptor subunit [Ketobacter sp.]
MNKALKFVLPIAAIVVGLAVSVLLFVSRPEVEHKPLNIKAPLVTITEVQPQSKSIPVFTRGTVTPGTEIQLMSEVSGQVLELSPNFANGGFFRKGEVLIRIDPIEYEVNIKRAEASKAQAYQAKLQAEAEKKARSRVKNTSSSRLANYDIQYRQAEAQYEAAVAELEAVKLQRDRTTVRAPFDGRVRLAALNVGQYVRPGLQMGAIYAVDVAEIRLPLSDRQLGLVDVPSRFQDSLNQTLPEVTLTEKFAGRTYTWKGKVVRAEGGVDERNRLLYVVAQVRDPYAADPNQPGRPELVSGSFVEATIDGRRFERVFEVPRKALRNGAQLWVVDENNQLRERDVAIIYKGKDSIYVSSGLESGDKVVLSQMDIAVDGMTVRTKVEDDFQYEVEPEKNNNLFGVTQTPKSAEPASVKLPDLNDPKVQELAAKAKDMYENLDAKQKQDIQQSAKEMLKQAQNLQVALQPKPREIEIQEPASRPDPVEPQPVVQAEPEMSPLAAQIAADIESSPPPTKAQPEIEPAPVARTSKPAGGGSITISIVSAPEPLVEAIQ